MQMSVQQALGLAQQHHQAGRLAEAESLYRQLLQALPHQPDLLHLLGVLLLQSGKADEAVGLIQAASQLAPERPDFCNNLGLALQSRGRLSEAIVQFELALHRQGDYFEACNNLGNALRLAGRHQDALSRYQRAAELAPERGEVFYHLAQQYQELNRIGAAALALERAAELLPASPDIWGDLAHNRQNRGYPELALTCFDQALALAPQDEALASARLFCLLLQPDLLPRQRFDAYQAWGEAQTALPPYTDWPWARRERHGRLRIGYVCSNFRTHSSAWLMLPLYRGRDKDRFEIYSYSAVGKPDALTAEFKAHSDSWREIQHLSDAEACAQIRRDEIDILVDLNGHTLGHRLGIFAAKPAPLQVTGFIFGGTSGLAAIDYRFTDRLITPPALAPWNTEKPYYLPSALCFQPPAQAPEVNAPPLLGQGYLTFGSGNRLFKLNDQVIRLWAGLLRACPDSRLRLKTPELDDAVLGQELLARFAAAGIENHRIDLLGRSDQAGQLAFYASLDIALDPFPYDGGITSCEALWMGLPVLALDCPNGQRGAALVLHQVGLADWLAATPEALIAKARSIAAEPALLQSLRPELRQRLANSPLCDQAAYLASIEAGYIAIHQAFEKV